MRHDLDIIQVAVGDPSFRGITRCENQDLGPFRFHRVDLPKSYHHGLPPTWFFAVLTQRDKARTREEVSSAISAGHDIVSRSEKSEDLLIMVSDDPKVHLFDNLPPNSPRAFYLDAPELTDPKRQIKPHLTPFIKALRRQLSTRDVSALLLSPYLRNKPAEGWRFFGRQRQMDVLVNSPENFLIVGARAIGKTSLLREIKRRVSLYGYSAYYVDGQDCTDEAQLAARILNTLDPRAYANAQRRQKMFRDEKILYPVLQKIAARGKAILLVDELGNVVHRQQRDQWRVLGVLRHFAQVGDLKVVGTGFQEVLFKQQDDFFGPFVNFGTTMRLGAFAPDEVREFLVGPLAVWGQLEKEHPLLEMVLKGVGTHPLLLQYFCSALFEKVVGLDRPDVIRAARQIIDMECEVCFREPVDLLFYNEASSTLKHMFLTRCIEIDRDNQPLVKGDLDDDWVEIYLRACGFSSTSRVRRNMLEGLALRGLTEPVGGNQAIQRIIAPIVYIVIKRTEPKLEKLLATYLREMERDAPNWRLEKQGKSPG